MKTFWIIILIIIVVAIGVWIFYALNPASPATTPAGGGSPAGMVTGTPAAGALIFDQSLSDGTITLQFPSALFGLATTSSQILVHPYIPPCPNNFNYCLYYIGSDYQGTNFESTGLSVTKRTDLATQAACLTALPDGYTGITPVIATSSDYAVSVFSPLGDAAAGHFATGAAYRLFYNGSCYEFQTVIGQSDYYNYPSGTIQQFTGANEAAVESTLTQVLATLTLPSGEAVLFPQAATSSQN